MKTIDPTCVDHQEGTIDLTSLDYGDGWTFWAMAPRWEPGEYRNQYGNLATYNTDRIIENMVSAWHIFDEDDEDDETVMMYWMDELNIEMVWVGQGSRFKPMAVELETGDVWDVEKRRFIDGHSH